ncbi:replication restart DNA helicase PriA [Motilibacter rhizosphaerae]|uniref:Probable replication restart protein PriA n=1 Tax=Motilibacter rhizosphaerae TaxID=598652 RepID=A0A4Q7NRJ8_9ACTN|nr:primosomal protein N' [Motilibacter rhizosphaerae]RZS89388.1 replication restart DNA helicase PriA [Motilibacter rhizosphaerae]
MTTAGPEQQQGTAEAPHTVPHEQLALVRERVRRAAPKPVDPPAAELPVARVALDVPLAHLDRPFDYLVPEGMSAGAQPGTRVRVRFAGRDVDGFVVAREPGSDHPGRLERVRRLVSPEPVLHPEVLELARRVADRYAGTLTDVLRLAVPPRHAAAEAEPAAEQEPAALPVADPAAWADYDGGPAALAALADGASPRVVWAVLPGPRWAAEVAQAVVATAASGRGALVLAPDQRDVDRLDAALTERLGEGRHVVLTAGLGPAERYRRYLRASRGEVRVVLGTRAAAFAPVQDLGLVLVWDDGDDSLAEPRAPYPHAREVALLRASAASSAGRPPALVLAGHAVTAEGALLVRSGWAAPLRAPRDVVRARAPRVVVPEREPGGEDPLAVAARIPTAAWRAASAALERGPVLVQVPRLGYLVRLACSRCRTPTACPSCSGPLALPAPGTSDADLPAALRCRWCATQVPGWRCPVCSSPGLRAVQVGAERTAEELGRAFPRARVLQSTGERSRARVPDRPAIVVATPGVEPVADAGYAAALLLDGGAMLARPALRAQEDALRRWLDAASLVRPAGEGGTVVVCLEGERPVVSALLRWDPFGHGLAELEEREPLGLPPAARVAVLSGAPATVAEAAVELDRLVREARLDGVRAGSVLELEPEPRPGSAPEPRARVLVRAPRRSGAGLAAALAALQAGRSARRARDPLRVVVDPVDLG